MKRLALFWLICTTAGFATAAAVACALAMVLDGGHKAQPQVETARATGSSAP